MTIEQLPLKKKWGSLLIEYSCTERRDVVFIQKRDGLTLVTIARERGIESKEWSPVYVNWCGCGNVDRGMCRTMKKALETAELLTFEMETGRIHLKFYKGD